MSGIKIALLGTSALIGSMTPAERSKGRYMRAPDHEKDDGFAEFEAAGEVEVGKSQIESNQEEGKPEKEEKPARRRAAEKPAKEEKSTSEVKPDEEDQSDEEQETDEDEDEEEEQPRKPKKASERIRELNARLRQSERLRAASDKRLDDIEKRLQAGNLGGNKVETGTPAPDPTDLDKYPLGHLDDRYIEDKLDWLAEAKAAKRADAALQRQQGFEQQEAANRQHAELLEKVDDLVTRGSELHDDFQEAVLDTGLRGEWDLAQATFEAAHEAENGAQILFDLSQDKKEASRVAKLSNYGQAKYVMERDAEISAKAKPRTKPGAGAPPSTQTRGANSSHKISPGTDNLDDFEKAWIADSKGK